MPWDFPRKVPKVGEVLSYESFNDGIVYLSELDGNLGEQNWSNDLATTLVRKDDLAEDVSLRVTHGYAYVDVAEFSDLSFDPDTINIAGYGNWQAVETKNVVTRGGELFLVGSVQLSRPQPAENAGPTDRPNKQDFVHVQVCFRVDGAIYSTLAVADQDDLEDGELMELGLQGWHLAAVVEGVIPISPGTHRVELVVRAVPSKTYTPVQDRNVQVQASTRELIVMESW